MHFKKNANDPSKYFSLKLKVKKKFLCDCVPNPAVQPLFLNTAPSLLKLFVLTSPPNIQLCSPIVPNPLLDKIILSFTLGQTSQIKPREKEEDGAKISNILFLFFEYLFNLEYLPPGLKDKLSVQATGISDQYTMAIQKQAKATTR